MLYGSDYHRKLQIQLKREISSITHKIDKVVDLLIETPSDALKEKLKELEAEREQLEIDYDRSLASEMTDEKIDKYLITVEDFAHLDRTQKQIFIRKIIKKITVQMNGD